MCASAKSGEVASVMSAVAAAVTVVTEQQTVILESLDAVQVCWHMSCLLWHTLVLLPKNFQHDVTVCNHCECLWR